MTNPVRRWPAALAVALLVALPTTAFFAAPSASARPAHPAHPAHPAAPGSALAGINTNATAAAVQVVAFLPGIAPVGNPALGNFLQASLPYANSSASTGPSTAGTASPVWPGDVAANAGNALQTFAPSIPTQVVNLLNDPVVARSSFPSQLNIKPTGTFQPGPAQAGVGSASTTSGKGSTFAKATINDTAPLGAASPSTPLGQLLGAPGGGLLGSHSLLSDASGSPLVEVSSANTQTTSTVHAASVDDSAQTQVSKISIAGQIQIDGISSAAAASSDGKTGHETSDLKIGAVTFAGLSASIDDEGITINKQSSLVKAALVPTANTLLNSLRKAGLTVATISPLHHVHGSHATVSSGAIQVVLSDKNIPNLGGLLPGVPLPLPSSAGLDINVGLSQADADATAFPKDHLPGGGGGPTHHHHSQPGGAGGAGGGGGGGGGGGSTGGGFTGGGGAGGGGFTGGGVTSTSGGSGGGATPIVAAPAASVFFGIPVRTAWVVISLLLALMTAGPLLAYANWQLLRGRTS